MNIDDYIKKYSYGLEYSNSIKLYVEQAGELPEYYTNTTSYLYERGHERINIFHLIDVLDIVEIVRYKVKDAYINLWRYLDGYEIDDEEDLLGLSTIALGIDMYMSILGFPSYEVFLKGRKFFEDWMIFKFSLKDGDNRIFNKLFDIRIKLAGFEPITYHFMSILGISTIPISTIN